MFLKLFLTLFFIKFSLGLLGPPSPDNAPLMARYLIHTMDWVSIATLSIQDDIKGSPFVGLKSMSDGTINNSTGIPYLYLSNLDVSSKDLASDNRLTIMATEAQSDYCRQKNLDPQDPRCAKVIITGRLIKVDKSSAEYIFGQNALFARHPEMQWWPKEHAFYVAKVDITKIAVLDFFGGMKIVKVEDYFKANLTDTNDFLFENVKVVEVDA